ncbi:MAG: hypothetical protein KGI91_08655 [Burkholderiales bacterium]|nr:hypothetical protein [Burkholderiales bacterium]MDE2077126.1 hypothetical protein [Burkholderiales bacterium]
MLNHSFHMRSRQNGIVLIIALIVLVAMTIAALALTKSVFTSNVIAGNIASQQATTHSADAGIEAAITWLENNNNVSSSSCAVGSTLLACDQPAAGYKATWQNPSSGQSWASLWNDNFVPAGLVKTLGTDGAGNTVSYVIQRMCTNSGDASNVGNDCSQTPMSSASSCSGGSSCDAGKTNLDSVSQVYYRITVQVVGPKNTQSYVQSLVAM